MPGRGAPPGAVAVGRPTKVPCGPVSGRIWVAHFVWENRPVHGPPHTKRPPRQRPPDPGATEPATGGRRWSESICGSEDGRGPLPPRRGLESTPTQLGIHPSSPLPVRRTLGRALTLRGTAGSLRRTGLRGFRAPVSSSSLPGRLSLCDRWRVGLAACVAPAPGTGTCRPPQSRCGPPSSGLHWLNHARGWPPPRAGVTEARGPLCPRHRWSLWIVGRWPVSIPRFPGGAAPWDPPFVGVVHGVRTPLLRAVCRSPPAPVRAFPRRDPLRADRCPRGFQWGQLDGHRLRSPGAPGRRRRGRALVRPFQLNSFTSWRSRSGALLGPRPGFDRLQLRRPRGG